MGTKNEATSTNVATGSILWRCSYSFVAPNGIVRNGQIAVDAASEEEAKRTAEEKLRTFGLSHPKVNAAKTY